MQAIGESIKMLSLATENSHDIKLQNGLSGAGVLSLARKTKRGRGAKAYINLAQSLS